MSANVFNTRLRTGGIVFVCARAEAARPAAGNGDAVQPPGLCLGGTQGCAIADETRATRPCFTCVS
ncbi:hypothetical protein QF026_007506 [Streptomyces aurantiacus]|nr:hypothetical protein [Streptomyces aurantiacus]